MAIRKLVRWDGNGASEVFHKHGEQTLWCRNPGRWELPRWLFFESGLWMRRLRAERAGPPRGAAPLELRPPSGDTALQPPSPPQSQPQSLAPPQVPRATP